MGIDNIIILGGCDKSGNKEAVQEVELRRGEMFSVVGPTGSGKSSLISDIEQLSQRDTSSGRQVLLNGKIPSYEERTDPRRKIVAQISQNMNFLADMTVEDFLRLHAKCRGVDDSNVNDVIVLANTLTGEPIKKEHNLTILSGGQSRALMVADVALICDSPVVLIDEIENAGIRKLDSLNALLGHGKIVMVVTHDPTLALMTDRRIVMKNGGMQKVIVTTPQDKALLHKLNHMDELLLRLREMVRNGESSLSLELQEVRV